MAFSASEAAVEGFRIVQREPKTIAGWSLVQLVFGIAVTVVTVPFMRPLTAFQTLRSAGATPTPAEALAALEPALGFLGAIIPLELVIFAVLSAAVYRTVLRPEDKGLARLRLGADELRMGILWIELGLLFWVIGTVVLMALVVMGVTIGVAIGNAAGGTVATVMVSYLVALAVMAWLAVRFSLAGPLTFVDRRVQLFSAWKLTRGRFWPLFGCYLLTFVFMLISAMVQLSVVAVASLAMSGGSLTQAASGMMRPDYSSLAAYVTPARIVALLINALVGGVYWAVAFAPAAVAYRKFVGATPRGQADVFG